MSNTDQTCALTACAGYLSEGCHDDVVSEVAVETMDVRIMHAMVNLYF